MMTREEVLTFWFADDPAAHRKVWFERDDAFDAACATLAAAREAAKSGALDHWADTPKGGLALLILLDQIPRNLFRGQAEAFATDAKAREVARAMIARGFDRVLTPVERGFVYLPFEHSEDLADQEEGLRLFIARHADRDDDGLEYARRHRDVIKRFGRFPHRNAALGRTNTPEEKAYLAEPGAGF
jgi:uncharacterized protein (DUF924 family)